MWFRFFTKWGVDAWVSSRFNPGVNHFIRELTEIGNSESFLFIDPYFGSTALFTFNYYRANNKTIGETAAIINDMRYIEDAVYYDKTIVGDVTESLLKLGSKFDYIFFNPDIEDYIDENFPKLLKTLHKVCKPKAKVVFTLSNPGYYLGIKDLLNGDITGDNSKKPYQPWLGIRFIDPEYVFKAAREQGFLCKVSGIDCPKIEKYTQIIKQLQPLVQDKSKAKALDYIFFLFELSPIDLL